MPERIRHEKRVLFLGRVTFQKGPEYFVEAASLVLQRARNIRFVMAGSGDMLNAMINMAAERGIADRFHFPGFMKGKQVYEVYKNSDVFVMPSVSEPFGIAPLEAMQCGTPSIISKQSGCGEILDKVIKTDYWDIHAMADANAVALAVGIGMDQIVEALGVLERTRVAEEMKTLDQAARATLQTVALHQRVSTLTAR